jgi:ATP-dependent exoDNAse (exonuclease V) alpha subunit
MSGKTEAVIGCAIEAANKGERVLIACPIGALVDTYRQKLPPNENIVIETIHASHRITRKADELYIPPGRLRTFDLIVYDEISQLEDSVWQQVRTAIVELNPHPFVCFVGDFKQLQPVHGDPELQRTLEAMVQGGTLRHVELQQHALSRSNDSGLLDFLSEIREHQPSKAFVAEFFQNRRLAPGKNCRKATDVAESVARSKQIEAATGKTFTFLTVTNQAARKINHTRCLMDFAGREEVVHWQLYAVPGDPEHGGDVVAISGMRVRLTRNVDKERGFVNGALAEIEYVLSKNVFIVKTPTNIRILVRRVRYDGQEFMPYTYGYATTMRRSQGSTMEIVGLWFDHSYPADRGYGYVGASRVRRAADLFLMGKIRRTDWLPVGGDTRDEEQERRGCDSATTSSNSDFGSEDQGGSSESDDEDQGASDSDAEIQSEEDQGASDSDEEDQGASGPES